MSPKTQRYNTAYDLSNCDEEPLRFIRSCQQGAVIIALYAETLRIKAISENAAARYGKAAESLLGADAGAVIGGDALAIIKELDDVTDVSEINPIELFTSNAQGHRRENLIVHRQEDLLLLEIEPRDANFGSTEFLLRIDKSMARVQSSVAARSDVFDTTVKEVKALTGYDRILLYKFDADYNGTVIAEAVEDGLPAYLNLRYPHTDIPKQARDLYLSQQIRQVTNTDKDSSSLLVTDDKAPIDLGKTANRGVSPLHLEYLRNIGVGSSMSIAITVEGRLWGLIACHHGQVKLVDYRLRQLLGFFGRILAGHLALEESNLYRSRVLSTAMLRATLVEKMSEGSDLAKPLIAEKQSLLNIMSATGAALVFDGEIIRLGECPTETEISRLVDLVASEDENVFATDTLHALLPDVTGFATAPAGMLSIRITRSPGEYFIWFRPEIAKTITWGGNPAQRKEVVDGKVRLHPNMSFARYTEIKRGQSEAWERYQLDNAFSFRNDIKEIILQKYQEMRQVNSQLTDAYRELESFSYSVSHDLRTPLRHIKGFSEILLEDYQEKLDEHGQSALKVIMRSVDKMNEFIDALLSFSHLGQQSLNVATNDLGVLLDEVWASLAPASGVELRTDLLTTELPGDRTLLYRMLLNLLSNAIKYRRKDVSSWIEVRSKPVGGHIEISIADNGIGFDMKHADEIFVVFNRLVSDDEIDGTGVGLATVHRIVEKHGGTIAVDSEPGVGTTFTVLIPDGTRENAHALT